MQNISFKKAPVIELVAELRWTPAGDDAMAAGNVALALGTQAEEFFQRFGNAVASDGFTQAERLVPSGVPLLVHHVVWRFRKPGDPNKLLQVGPGLFSANALQPYRRWREFEPTIALGVKALLASRAGNETDLPFNSASLRYINAFSGDLLGGKGPAAFISDVLGFKQSMPTPISSLHDPNRSMSASVNLLVPIVNTTKTMKLVIGDGAVKAEPAAIFDITVTEPTQVATSDALTTFKTSRDIIHQCFLNLTKSLHEAMQPESDE
jgi:uncharacterized protein (TIGR04255 family)